jgi:putative FmdB family regulatory protein
MPIYEYACAECDHRFEAWQRITDPPLTTCASCGAERARRLISATAFSLKGTGWYATDYRGNKGGDSSSSSSA